MGEPENGNPDQSTGDSHHTETSPLTRIANQWNGFNVIGTSAIEKLMTN